MYLVWIQVSPESEVIILLILPLLRGGAPLHGYVEGTNGVKHQIPHNTWGGVNPFHTPKKGGKGL
ncbi:MAG: hypothetical protein CIT02_08910 [Methanobacterium sp. BAmetb5]|nr:MAG: hypothetical protein CIT02_08910 [Methanobacterium sp. BAmetb5]